MDWQVATRFSSSILEPFPKTKFRVPEPNYGVPYMGRYYLLGFFFIRAYSAFLMLLKT
jgi:hypothetical protein